MIIKINKLQLPFSVGVYDFEKKNLKTLIFNITIKTDTDKAAHSDNVKDTIDYDKIASLVKDVSQAKHYNLIETISRSCCEIILGYNNKITYTEVEVIKPDSVMNSDSSAVIYSLNK